MTDHLEQHLDQDKRKPDFNELIQDQGGLGPFQVLVWIIIEIQTAAGNIIAYGLPYLLLYPILNCEMQDGWQQQCTIEDACNSDSAVKSYSYDWTDQRTLHNFITDFQLLCDSHFEIGFFAQSYFIGLMIMSAITPYFQDKYGRWKVFQLASTVNLLVLIGYLCLPKSEDGFSSTTQYFMYLLFFILGLETPGRMLTGFVYYQEFLPDRYQYIFGTFGAINNACIVIALILYFKFGNYGWKWPVLLGAIMNFITLVFSLYWLPESPKWLLSRGRYTEAYKVFKQMASFNGTKPTHIMDLLLVDSAQIEEPRPGNIALDSDRFTQTDDRFTQSDDRQSHSKSIDQIQQEVFLNTQKVQEKKFNVRQELFSNKYHLVNMIIMSCVWLSASFNFYLIGYQLKYLKGDIFINGIVSSLSEVVAAVTTSVFLYNLGIKLSLMISFWIAAAGMLCLIFVSTDNQIILAIFILGSKYGVTQVFNMSYLGNVKVFPTSLVATSFGVCNIFARFGTQFAPFIAELKPETISKWVFTIMMLVSAVIVLGLKQNAKDLPPPQKKKKLQSQTDH